MSPARAHEIARGRAGAAVHAAVVTGQLPPAHTLACEGCGGPAVEYHHHADYAPENWLEVTAVCRGCHRRIHNGTLAEPRTGQLRAKPTRRASSSDPFPQWLRATRKAHGQNQADLAIAAQHVDADCCVHQVRLSEWELGKTRPSLRQFRILCLVLELTLAEQAEGQALWDAAELTWQHGRGAVAEPPRMFTDRESAAIVRAFCGTP